MADDHPMAAGTCKEHNLWSNPAPITPELAARLQRLAEALEDLRLTPEQIRAARTMAEESARATQALVNRIRAFMQGRTMDLGRCIRCGLPVSAGICDTPPLQFHDRPEQCIEALKAELARVHENARGDEP